MITFFRQPAEQDPACQHGNVRTVSLLILLIKQLAFGFHAFEIRHSKMLGWSAKKSMNPIFGFG